MPLTEIDLIVLRNLVKNGGTGNIMGFLNYTQSDFDKGFEFANNLQNQDLVKLLYSNFNKNQIVVELTLIGTKAGNS